MKVYLDYVFIINFFFDFLLLLSVSILLRRNIKLKKIVLGSIVGSLSTFLLFIKISSIELFIYKLVISILMIIITFSFKNIKYTIKNISYLYLVSIILGGSLYLINNQLAYNKEGLVFYHNGLSINIILIIIITPFIIYIYLKQHRELKTEYSNYYKINIKYKEKNYHLNAFLDTGNKLIDPITKIPIIIVKEKEIKNIDKYMIVPYTTITGKYLLKCIKADEIKINNEIVNKKVLLGLINNFKMEGVDCILNPLLLK